MKLLFGWHISFKRLYFKSSRVEYQIRLWRKVKYKRPKKEQISAADFITTHAYLSKNIVEEGK